MKRLLSFMLTLALCLPMIACGLGNTPADNGGAGNGNSTNHTDTQTPETPEVPAPPYTFVTETTADKYSNDEGKLIASYSYSIIRMKLAEGADEAVQTMAETFNAEMDALLGRCLESGEELGDWAIYDPNIGDGNHYTDEVDVSWEQVGDFLSISYNGYYWAGGAHGMPNCYSYLFDLERGVYIDPIEIADDPELFRYTVTDLLLDELDSNPDYAGGFFEDYAATTSKWNEFCVLLGETDMTVVFAPYVLGPYAMGAVEVSIGYDEIRTVLGEGGVERLGI